jgi:hypothetical protein
MSSIKAVDRALRAQSPVPGVYSPQCVDNQAQIVRQPGPPSALCPDESTARVLAIAGSSASASEFAIECPETDSAVPFVPY